MRRLLRKYSEVQIKETLHYCLTTPGTFTTAKKHINNILLYRLSSSSSSSLRFFVLVNKSQQNLYRSNHKWTDPRKSHKTSSSNKSSSSSGSIQRVDSEDSQPVIGAPVQNADVKLEEVDIKKIDDDMKARAMQLFSRIYLFWLCCFSYRSSHNPLTFVYFL